MTFYIRPPQGQATFRFRVTTLMALAVTLSVRGLMAQGAVNSWIALAMFLARAERSRFSSCGA
jgi:hypothetical protein